MIPIFIASDQRSKECDRVLSHSITRHTIDPWIITWMRAGDSCWQTGSKEEIEGVWHAWNIGRPNSIGPYSGEGWATQFTNFRWAVPELCGFKGRAIYMDNDTLVLRDLGELFELPMNGAALLTRGWRSDVTLFDCAAFKDIPWPTLDRMRASGRNIIDYINLLCCSGRMGKLPVEWNNIHQLTEDTGIYHFTNMRTQPWKPYPEVFAYDQEHVCPEAVNLWWEYCYEAKEAMSAGAK